MINKDISKFHEEGYVLLEGLVKEVDLDKLLKYQDDYFDAYFSSLDNNLTRNHVLYQNKIFVDDNRKIRIDGVPLEHRILRGAGSPIISDTPYSLYGKRASKNIKDFKPEALASIFTKELIQTACHLLQADDLAFLQGSANRMYPKYSGEDKIMHIDTYGFTYGVNKILSEEDFFINALLYLNGSRNARSATKIIPKSHREYHEVNKLVAKALKLDSNKNQIHQRELYEEILPEHLKREIIEVEADPGDVLIINSNLIHGISGNNNAQEVREAIILNFSKASSKHFGKSRNTEDYNLLNSLLKPYGLHLGNTPSAVKFRTFSRSLISMIKNRLNKFRKPKSETQDQRLPIEKMPYLNIGSGRNWKDPYTIGLDINVDMEVSGYDSTNICDVEFDLLSMDKMPFDNSRFEGIYTSHTLEHLKDHNVKHIIREVNRILKTGGCFRVTVPNIDLYFDNYEKKNLNFFNWVRNKTVYRYDSWLRLITREFAGPVVDNFEDNELLTKYENLGRRGYLEYFQKLSNDCGINERLIPDIHKSYWNPEKMIYLLKESGFGEVKEKSRFDSSLPYFANKDNDAFNRTRPHASLFIEGIKI